MTTKQRARVGRIEIDPVTLEEAFAEIERLVENERGGTVFTPNVDHVVLAEENDRFRRAYERASLSLVDGMPVLWAARVLGRPLPEKVSGSDLVVPLAGIAAERGWRVYLLGGADGVAVETAEILTRRYPGLKIVGAESPRVDIDDPAEKRATLVATVAAAQPDLVFVALGSPKQEIWCAEVADALSPAVLVGVGATFDFITGKQTRAPAWVSSMGMEWFYRLSKEPRRLWRRYLVRDPKFFLIVARRR